MTIKQKERLQKIGREIGWRENELRYLIHYKYRLELQQEIRDLLNERRQLHLDIELSKAFVDAGVKALNDTLTTNPIFKRYEPVKNPGWFIELYVH